MRHFVYFLLLFALATVDACVGCINAPSVKPIAEELREEYYGTAATVEVNDYKVIDDGQMIIFSSAPIEGDTGLEYEKKYLKEFKSVLAAVSRWKKAHPDVKVSIAVSERGGHAEHNEYNAYYTVRVVLLRE